MPQVETAERASKAERQRRVANLLKQIPAEVRLEASRQTGKEKRRRGEVWLSEGHLEEKVEKGER